MTKESKDVLGARTTYQYGTLTEDEIIKTWYNWVMSALLISLTDSKVIWIYTTTGSTNNKNSVFNSSLILPLERRELYSDNNISNHRFPFLPSLTE